jgi:hypothetical protein
MIVLFGAVVLAITGIDINADGEGFAHALWEILLRAMSPDQLTGQSSWSARILLLVVTLLGLLMFSTLVSISNSALSQRFEQVRRGRKPISLSRHISILNWNEFGFRVLREVAEANQTAAEPHHVAILCDQDPLDLMRQIESNFRDHSESLSTSAKPFRYPDKWITIRRGLGHHTADLLNLAAVDSAAGVIVLHEEENEDSQVVRCVLAISAALRSRGTDPLVTKQGLPVVTFNSSSSLAHLLDHRLSTIAASYHADSYRHVNFIPLSPDEIRIGIETQVARHRGLSYVYQDLLDFGGEEMYILEPPHDFATFGEAFSLLSDSIPLGIITNDGVDLWPDWTAPVSESQVVVLARDRRSSNKCSKAVSNLLTGVRGAGRAISKDHESFLFVGWNSSADELVESLPSVVAPGSSLKVLLKQGSAGPKASSFGSRQIEISYRNGIDPLDDPSYLSDVHHVVVFADMTVSAQQSDAQVLIDLLACRHFADHLTDSERRFTIVGELRRRSSRHVAGIRLADDLLVSESLMAAAATQLVFEPRLEGVIAALLSRNNPVEIITIPMKMLSNKDRVSWRELQLNLARDSGEIAIGVRTIRNGDPEVTLNPNHDVILRRQDEVVLLSRCRNLVP